METFNECVDRLSEIGVGVGTVNGKVCECVRQINGLEVGAGIMNERVSVCECQGGESFKKN